MVLLLGAVLIFGMMFELNIIVVWVVITLLVFVLQWLGVCI